MHVAPEVKLMVMHVKVNMPPNAPVHLRDFSRLSFFFLNQRSFLHFTLRGQDFSTFQLNKKNLSDLTVPYEQALGETETSLWKEKTSGGLSRLARACGDQIFSFSCWCCSLCVTVSVCLFVSGLASTVFSIWCDDRYQFVVRVVPNAKKMY